MSSFSPRLYIYSSHEVTEPDDARLSYFFALVLVYIVAPRRRILKAITSMISDVSSSLISCLHFLCPLCTISDVRSCSIYIYFRFGATPDRGFSSENCGSPMATRENADVIAAGFFF